jgi:hypothetical protein
VDTKKKIVGVGILARDHMGKVLGAMCSVQSYITDPTTAEALGTHWGVEFGRFLSLNSLILEGDALEVVLALQRDDEGAGSYGSLIVDTRAVLSGVRSWVIQHVGRDGNMAAHHLAKLAVSS